MEGITITTNTAIDETEQAVRAALGDAGFGILTEIDIAATLKAKLGVERTPLKILGACNPELAHQALTADPSVALLLPCNVVLETTDDGGTRVTAADPRQLMTADSLSALADDAANRLRHALSTLSQPGPVMSWLNTSSALRVPPAQ